MYGAKWVDGLSREERKARLLTDLKAVVTQHTGGKGRITLRERRGRGTLSLQATVSHCGPYLNPVFLGHEVRGWAVHPERDGTVMTRHLPAAQALVDAVKAEADAHNFDESDISTDYFHVGFYFDVDFKDAELDANRMSILQRCSPKRYALRKLARETLAVVNDARLERGVKPLGRWASEGDIQNLINCVRLEFGHHSPAVTTLEELCVWSRLVGQSGFEDDWSDAAATGLALAGG